MNYYTLQIHYGDSGKPKVENLQDLHPGTMEEKAWIRSLRENLFRTGFHIQAGAATWEFITPFHIHKVFLIKQEGRIGID